MLRIMLKIEIKKLKTEKRENNYGKNNFTFKKY